MDLNNLKYCYRLSDNTCGYSVKKYLIGETKEIFLYDENGNVIKKTGLIREILIKE